MKRKKEMNEYCERLNRTNMLWFRLHFAKRHLISVQPEQKCIFLSNKNIRLFANPLYLMTFPFFCMSALGRNVNEIKKKNNNRADVRQHTPKHTWTNTCTYRRIFPSVFVSRDVLLCIKYIMRDNRLSPSGSQKKN